ncbi:glycosyltransferase [Flexithrix dorotheae]|uniref:glycosyltransferase n=1 Tax=Flexithrix dorotheae TaxID=70993 RepID=UPI0005C5A3F6|nr:glycosyltransferase [Flexithrix dorotheae]
MEGRSIIILGNHHWDKHHHDICQQFAIAFSKTCNVLYVNPPLNRISSIRHSDNPAIKYQKKVNVGKSEDLVQVNDNLWILYPKMMEEPIQWLASSSIYNILNKQNARKLAYQIKLSCRKLRIEEFEIFSTEIQGKSIFIKDILKPTSLTYFTEHYQISKRRELRSQTDVVIQSDFVFTNSMTFMAQFEELNENVFYLPTGFNKNLVSLNEEQIFPADLKNTKYPIIGYFGNLDSENIDVSTLHHMVDERPHWNFVIVGKVSESFLRENSWHNKPNIWFLGEKSHHLINSYMQAFDVCILPLAINDFTDSTYPEILDAYLTLGKPVVVTHLKATKPFQEHVYLASSPQGFVVKTEHALAENNEKLIAERIAFSKSHTINHCAKLILESTLQKQNIQTKISDDYSIIS